ncbi:DUF3572 family protein [Lichenibacterium ramalinae]|uniref:DUF3572 family protein n=1 Tax=Lichenibacterium ramalinae TaxID=2316527 RepID=A0A4Q2RDI3_9HYPH|nr:DUF3572 family protein [Lichenibacterium ramalinae]
MTNSHHGHTRRTSPGVDPDLLAIQALTFIASNPEHAERFLALSGLGPGDLRGAAADPAFLLGVMDYLVADEPLLLLFAADAGLAPEAVVAAHDRLSRR